MDNSQCRRLLSFKKCCSVFLNGASGLFLSEESDCITSNKHKIQDAIGNFQNNIKFTENPDIKEITFDQIGLGQFYIILDDFGSIIQILLCNAKIDQFFFRFQP